MSRSLGNLSWARSVEQIWIRKAVKGDGAFDPSTTSGIVGMSDSEGQQLLDDLTAHATQPEFVYRHDWQIGDLVMWDNALVLHRRDPFDAAQNRLLKRLTMRLSTERHLLPLSTLSL